MTDHKRDEAYGQGSRDRGERRAEDDRTNRGRVSGSDLSEARCEGRGDDVADRALVELISAAYAAPELSARRRAELDAELYARIEHGRGWRLLLAPGLGVAVAVGLIALLLAPQSFERGVRDDGRARLASETGEATAASGTEAAAPAPRTAMLDREAVAQSAAQAGDVAATAASIHDEAGASVTEPAIDSDYAAAAAARAAELAETNPAAAWEYGLLFSNTAGGDTEETDEELALPADYRAIAELFMAG